MARKPNILFVFSDQHRHGVLGCAGHPLVQTPNLDRLADWGMRFERTWSQCPVCMPCRATMITGRYAHEFGYTDNVTARRGGTVDDSPFKLGVRDEAFRITLHVPTETPCELYDLATDPGELNNCVDEPAYREHSARLKAAVLDHRGGEARVRLLSPGTGARRG